MILEKLKKDFEEYFFDHLEVWDQNSAMSSLEDIISDIWFEDDSTDQILENFDFSFLLDDEKLQEMSDNLADRIDRRGYIILDLDGKGFYKRVISLIKKQQTLPKANN